MRLRWSGLAKISNDYGNGLQIPSKNFGEANNSTLIKKKIEFFS
jgi:hypothetical protein